MFKFNNISSDDMGVIVEEDEFIARAAIRYEEIETEGKDGALYEELGYSDVERNIVLQCLDNTKIDEILAWLNGFGTLEYNNRKTDARFYTELVPKRNSAIKNIECNFIRGPFWSKVNDEYEIVNGNINNIGNIASRPILRLEKGNSESIDITIGNIRFKYNFNDEEYVEIDCNTKKVLYENLNRSRQIEIDYKFPKIEVGNNIVTIHEGDASIKVKRKDRWL